MVSRSEKVKEVIKKADPEIIKWIYLQFVDIGGKIKSVEIPTRDLPKVFKKGKGFDGSSILGGVRIHESDMLLIPDPFTYTTVPWVDSGDRARVICDVYRNKQTPFDGCPRRVLKNNIAAMQAKFGDGTDFAVATEPEFYILKEVGGDFITPEEAGYFDLDFSDFRIECAEMMEKVDIKVEAGHHEVGLGGQHEIDYAYGDAIKVADQTTVYKEIIKQVAKRHDLTASFMPKPFGDKAGSGMHVHINLKRDGENLFFDGKKRGKRLHLSDTALYFMGGIMKHARALSAILSSTPNSYKRLGVSEAPNYVLWARKNRSAFIRIPDILDKEYDSVRLELRSPDPACNPYLAFGVILAAGMHGIKRKIDPGDPRNEDIQNMSSYDGVIMLPGTLGEALSYLERDKVIIKALGDHCMNEFMKLKTKEWNDYKIMVGTQERQQYINL
jgi:glutamine synthetase